MVYTITIMANKNNVKYEFLIMAWLLANGFAVGHLISDIRTILTRGYRFDNDMGLDVTLTLIAISISAQRALYWYNQKKENHK